MAGIIVWRSCGVQTIRLIIDTEFGERSAIQFGRSTPARTDRCPSTKAGRVATVILLRSAEIGLSEDVQLPIRFVQITRSPDRNLPGHII